MKKLLLLIPVLFSLAWVAYVGSPLTEATVNDKKEQCKMQLDAYFYDYGLLLNIKKTGEEKDKIISKIQNDYFVDNTMIESDNAALHKPQYDSQIYFDNIQETFGQIDGIIETDIKEISDVYYDNAKDRYFLIANVVKKVNVKDGVSVGDADTSKKSLDIYYSFTLEDRKPKIFSIQNHKENALEGLTPVQIIPDQEANKNLSESKSYFVFKIVPADAEVALDGQPIEYTNGQEFETTPGRHSLQISSNNYTTQNIDVDVNIASTVSVERNLDPQGGYLNITNNSPDDNGAIVFVNDIQVGTLPLNNYPLATGEYKIRIRKYNGEKVGVVTINENRSTTVNASFRSRGFLRGFITGGYVTVNANLLPHYYFTEPLHHTYMGMTVHPYYNPANLYRRTGFVGGGGISHYQNRAIRNSRGQIFRPRTVLPASNHRTFNQPMGGQRGNVAPQQPRPSSRGFSRNPVSIPRTNTLRSRPPVKKR